MANSSPSAKIATKAQRELLAWMVAAERRGSINSPSQRGWRGGDLINYYAEKAEARRQRWDAGDRSDDRGYMGAGGYASHGWRRAGGTALKNLAARGYVEMTQISIGVPIYELTDEGRAIGNETPP